MIEVEMKKIGRWMGGQKVLKFLADQAVPAGNKNAERLLL